MKKNMPSYFINKFRIHTVWERKVYNSVFPAERNGGFCHAFCKLTQTASLTACKQHRNDFFRGHIQLTSCCKWIVPHYRNAAAPFECGSNIFVIIILPDIRRNSKGQLSNRSIFSVEIFIDPIKVWSGASSAVIALFYFGKKHEAERAPPDDFSVFE